MKKVLSIISILLALAAIVGAVYVLCNRKTVVSLLDDEVII